MKLYMTHHPAYKIRTSILQRCYNPKTLNYNKHGALGIKVCQEWLDDPQSFVDWADATGFEKGAVIIARKDLSGDFTPDNCIWVPCKRREYVSIQEGDLFKTSEGYTAEVVEYIDRHNISILFRETGNYLTTTKESIRIGILKNPLHSAIFGVGFNFGGPHKTSEVVLGKRKSTKEYQYWMDMMRRCYDTTTNFYNRYGGRGVFVDQQWHNFQEFAEWCQWQVGFGQEGWQLDKDWLSNKDADVVYYGPEVCCFVPRRINCLITKVKGDVDPTGVDSNTSKGRFRVSVNQEGGRGKSGYVGSYGSFEEASNVYKTLKKGVVNKVAEEYKEHMDNRLYITMLDWEAP